MKLFHPESPFMRFLSWVADLIVLNLVWLVCCIPVVTIGPATAAMYRVVLKIIRRDHPSILRTFFREFKDNFKQALALFLIMLIPAALAVGYLVVILSGGLYGSAVQYICYIAVFIIAVVWSYMYPLVACFDNTVGNTLKNALLLPTANPLFALVVTALNMLPFVLLLIDLEKFIQFGFFWLVIGFSLTALVNMYLLRFLFRKVAPREFEDE